MRAIEPGCRAVCLHESAMNEACTVSEFVKENVYVEIFDGITSSDGWIVDFDDGEIGLYQECFLVRIDGHEEPTKQRESEAV